MDILVVMYKMCNRKNNKEQQRGLWEEARSAEDPLVGIIGAINPANISTSRYKSAIDTLFRKFEAASRSN